MNNKNSIEIEYKLEDIEKISSEILSSHTDKKVWLFEGEMGSGKTTLIKSICKLLGVEEVVTSPTYNIVNEYNTKKNKIIYHFDLYRITSQDEAFKLGLNEYFEKADYCFIEWPSNVELNISENILILKLIKVNQKIRKVILYY